MESVKAATNTSLTSSSNKHPTTKTSNGGLNDSLLDSALHIPVEIINRINALKNLHLKLVDIESKFYEELHHLECKYATMYVPIFEQREQIVTGKYEPSEEECKYEYDHDKSEDNKAEELSEDLKNKVTLESGADSNAKKITGIPEFWLNSFKSTDLIRDMIQEYDEPVLRHLIDIKVIHHDEKPFGYTLEFHFSENEYFTNKVLTKRYWLTTDKDENDPLIYDGPMIYKCTGTKIEWNKDKDITSKLVKKKQKHKSSGTIRIVTKTEKQDSFFNFFEAPTEDGVRPSLKVWLTRLEKGEAEAKKVEEDADEERDEESEALYEADFEIGHFMKEFLIPKAILYFTGELADEDNYDDDEEDEEDDYSEGEGDHKEDNDDEEEEEIEDDDGDMSGIQPQEDEDADDAKKTKSK